MCGGQNSNGATPLAIGGSFAIAAVCRDGILLGADSRATIQDDSGKKLAYYAGVQKVFPMGGAALAYTGRETIQNLYFGAIVHTFVQTMTDDIRPDRLIPKFLHFTGSTLPKEAADLVRRQQLIVAGYLDGNAVAGYYNAAQTDGPRSVCGLGLVSSDRTIIDDRKAQLRCMEVQELGELIREAILRYARDNKRQDIGGPVYIRAISEDSSRWLGSVPTRTNWTYLHEFASSYWAGEVQLHLLPGVTREKVEEVIKKGEAWSKNPGRRS